LPVLAPENSAQGHSFTDTRGIAGFESDGIEIIGRVIAVLAYVFLCRNDGVVLEEDTTKRP
jgi:hypothetical protein